MNKLKEFGIYTSEDNVRVIVEETNEELSFFDFPMYYFAGVNKRISNHYISQEPQLIKSPLRVI